ncbi:hypothetical protein OV760_29765, partial [Salmonella enterica subsp. enterica serovar 1,4,[5],12:i:-]|nr:hypothetical protein [Salmonella enterica subsp. enterica serovar 1,4,[5],12:i:-]
MTTGSSVESEANRFIVFCSVEGKLSMLQNTIKRLASLSTEEPVVIANDNGFFCRK